LDELDKAIMLAWEGNCRLSYQVLARRFEVTNNTIKKRVKRLLEIGAIQGFAIELSLAMLDAEFVFADIVTDGTEDFEQFLEQVGRNRQIELVWRYADGSYCAYGEVVGAQGILELGQFLRRISGVTQVALHPAVGLCPVLSPLSKANTRGQKVEFTPRQLRVLEYLAEDPRMAITKLAQRSKLTPRRVRRILKELQEGGGLYFTIRWDHSAFGDIDLELRIRYDDTKVIPSEILDWVKEHYGFQYWVSYIFGDEPTVEIIMVVKDLREAETITTAVKAAPFTTDISVRVIYPKRKFQGLGHTSLAELLTKSGLKAK
jgi:DNA-binding Lrp family transcriptional regulator